MNRLKRTALLLGTILTAACGAHAEGKVHLLDPSGDAFIAHDLGDLNMGGMGTLGLGKSNKQGRLSRVLVKFDPAASGVRRDRQIRKAVLRLNWHVFLWWHPDNVIRVYRVLRPWKEGAGKYAKAKDGEVTWNSAMHGKTPWDVPGCGGTGDRSGEFVERRAASHSMDFDVTGLYRAWQRDGGEDALSFLVVADGAGQRSASPRDEYIITIVSRESTEPTGAALLLMEGTPPLRGPAPLWSHRVLDPKGNPRPAQFGMVHEGAFYGSSYNGHVYKIDLATGKLLADWFVTPNGCYSAPLAVDGKLYLLARDKKFRRLVEGPEPRAVVLADYSSEPGTTRVESLAYDPAVKRFFLGTGSSVHAVDESGKEHWQLPHKNVQWGEPMGCDGALYTYDTGTKEVVKYLTSVPDPPRKVWTCRIGALYAALAKGADGDGDTLIFVSGWKPARPGSITAVRDDGPDAGTPKWGPIALPHPLKHCSLWEGRNLLLLPAQNGYVECRGASTGRFVRRIPIPAAAEASTPWSQVTISGPCAVVTTHDGSVRDNFLYVFDIASGKELWRSAPFNGAVGCMIPVLSDGIGVIGTYKTGTWHAFRIGKGKSVVFSRFANGCHTGCVPGGLTAVAR